jgi:hypothetical protein
VRILEPRRDDFWRVRSAVPTTVPFQEWQHFTVLAPGVDLLVNFSLAGPPGLGPGAARTGRVIVLARTREWTGFVEPIPRPAVARDGCRGRFGAHRIELRARGYRIVVDAPAHGVFLDATFRPRTVPITARRQALAPGCHLDWRLTARLAVEGRLEIGNGSEAFDLAGAAGYHDHNWGHFAWGDDFAWEWGSVLPRDGGDWAVVYSSLMNRARTELLLEQVFVWRGPLNVFAAGGLDVRARGRGRCVARPALRVPPPMALLHGRGDTDVPRRLEIAARRGGDELTLRFAPESVAQVLVPSERSPRGIVAIHECVGPVDLLGRIGDETIHWEGRGVFELVR